MDELDSRRGLLEGLTRFRLRLAETGPGAAEGEYVFRAQCLECGWALRGYVSRAAFRQAGGRERAAAELRAGLGQMAHERKCGHFWQWLDLCGRPLEQLEPLARLGYPSGGPDRFGDIINPAGVDLSAFRARGARISARPDFGPSPLPAFYRAFEAAEVMRGAARGCFGGVFPPPADKVAGPVAGPPKEIDFPSNPCGEAAGPAVAGLLSVEQARALAAGVGVKAGPEPAGPVDPTCPPGNLWEWAGAIGLANPDEAGRVIGAIEEACRGHGPGRLRAAKEVVARFVRNKFPPAKITPDLLRRTVREK